MTATSWLKTVDLFTLIKRLLFPCSLDFNLGFFNYGCELNFCDSSSCSLVGAPLSILVLTSIISVTATYWQQLLVFPPLRRIVFALCPQFLLDPQRLVGMGFLGHIVINRFFFCFAQLCRILTHRVVGRANRGIRPFVDITNCTTTTFTATAKGPTLLPGSRAHWRFSPIRGVHCAP